MIDDPAAAAERAAPRIKIFMPTDLEVGGRSMRAHLLDLSVTGALAYAPIPPQEGASVQLACGVALRRATVMWVAGPRFGLAFALPLTPAQVDAVLLQQEQMIADAAQRLSLAHAEVGLRPRALLPAAPVAAL